MGRDRPHIAYTCTNIPRLAPTNLLNNEDGLRTPGPTNLGGAPPGCAPFERDYAPRGEQRLALTASSLWRDGQQRGQVALARSVDLA